MGYFKKWWLAAKNEIEPIPEFKASEWKSTTIELKPLVLNEYRMHIHTNSQDFIFYFLTDCVNSHELTEKVFDPALKSGEEFFVLSGHLAFGEEKEYSDNVLIIRMVDIIDINVVKIGQEEDENND